MLGKDGLSSSESRLFQIASTMDLSFANARNGSQQDAPVGVRPGFNRILAAFSLRPMHCISVAICLQFWRNPTVRSFISSELRVIERRRNGSQRSQFEKEQIPGLLCIDSRFSGG